MVREPRQSNTRPAPSSSQKGRARRRDAVVNRDKILASAAELMALHGHNVPLADIADKAGVGIGTLYRGSRDRPALLGELQRRGYELLLSCLAQIRADGLTGADALEEYLDKCLTLSDQLVALPLRGVAPLGDDATVDAKRRIGRTIGDLLAEGKAEGTVCPDVTTTTSWCSAHLSPRRCHSTPTGIPRRDSPIGSSCAAFDGRHRRPSGAMHATDGQARDQSLMGAGIPRHHASDQMEHLASATRPAAASPRSNYVRQNGHGRLCGIETTTLAPAVSCVSSVITAESVLILLRS